MGKLGNILRPPQKEYLNFEAGLTLMLHLPSETVSKLLSKRISHLESEMDNLKAQLHVLTERFHLDRALILEGEYTVVMREAELNWVRAVVKEINDGKLQWNSILETTKLVGEEDADT